MDRAGGQRTLRLVDEVDDPSALRSPAERLSWLLRQEDLTHLAERVHKDRTTLASYRVGRREPNLRTLAAICRATGVSADWVLGLSEQL